MEWLFLAFACAIAVSFADLLLKAVVRDGSNMMSAAWFRWSIMAVGIISVQVLLPAPRVSSGFFLGVIGLLPIEILAFVLFVKSLSMAPLSLTIPFLAFTPAFTILTGYFFAGDRITAWGVGGILLVALGAYLLNVGEIRSGGWRGPLRAILRERGSVLALITAVLWSITSTGGKILIGMSSPLYFAAVYFGLGALLFFPVALGFSEVNTEGFIRWRRIYLVLGLASFFEIFLHVSAMSIAPVSYMIAVKRLSLLFSILWGRIFFKEERIRERFLGGGVMVIGVALIALGG